MNDVEIRERLRHAVGEVSYPQDFSHRVGAELSKPRPRATRQGALGLIAILLALAVIAALAGPRLLIRQSYQPRPQPASSPAASPVAAGSSIPAADLAAAQLSGHADLVTPLNLTSTNGTGRVDLIGAYADPARTVLFFRTALAMGSVHASITDDYGFLNYGGSGNPGVPGHYVSILDGGVRPGVDGVAHLKISAMANGPGSSVSGSWEFATAVHVQPSFGVATLPQQIMLGSWKITLESAELTPSVLHVQALVEGATIDELGQNFIAVVDSSGLAVPEVAGEASVTVPKQQLNSSTVRNTRINYQWRRPTKAGTYELKFRGNGAQQTIRLDLSQLDAPTKNKPGGPPQPTDFPAAPQSLKVEGSLTADITTGRPSACGAATGPSGTIFAFALYFQAGGNWYWLDFSTDPTAQRYNGLGTYGVPAWLYSIGPNGPGQVLYEGTAQLTVTSQQDGHYTGSVRATLRGLEVTGTQSSVTVSGDWTCTFGPNLGPA